mmetsp:Transcript_42038/g.67602  ORF Transcript_42038/g.67602 Transcript_42038/m.67602 type:complete len:246 (+) Transcript_42038:1137-1874(+)
MIMISNFYKCIKFFDIFIEILDIRNPNKGRNLLIENSINSSKLGNPIIILLNKVDLIPKWVIKFWIKYYSKNNFVLTHSNKSINNKDSKYFIKLLSINSQIYKNKIKKILVFGKSFVGKSTFIRCLQLKIKSKSYNLKEHAHKKMPHFSFIKLTRLLYICETNFNKKTVNLSGFSNKSLKLIYAKVLFQLMVFLEKFLLKKCRHNKSSRNNIIIKLFQNYKRSNFSSLHTKFLKGKVPNFIIPFY